MLFLEHLPKESSHARTTWKMSLCVLKVPSRWQMQNPWHTQWLLDGYMDQSVVFNSYVFQHTEGKNLVIIPCLQRLYWEKLRLYLDKYSVNNSIGGMQIGQRWSRSNTHVWVMTGSHWRILSKEDPWCLSSGLYKDPLTGGGVWQGWRETKRGSAGRQC